MNNVVLLDNYPKRSNRAVDFRFFVVLPPDAVPIDKKIAKPLLSSKILAGNLWQDGFQLRVISGFRRVASSAQRIHATTRMANSQR